MPRVAVWDFWALSDFITLKGMTFYGYHGISIQEKELGQPFVVDLELHLDLRLPGRSDDLGDTTDYSKVYVVVREILEGPSHNLLESLAERIAQELLVKFSLEEVRVRVTKPKAPIKGTVLGEAGVEITRRRME